MSPPDLLEHLDAVRRLVGIRPMGLFVDIDGTIAPIKVDPAAAVVSGEVRDALATLAERITVVALTGRDVATARGLVGLDSVVYAGNHGAEWLEDGRTSVLPEVQSYVASMHALAENATRRLSGIEGLYIEDKGPTVSLHYRGTHDLSAARDEILAVLRQTPEAHGLAVSEGKMVVEVRPPVAVSKGTALTRMAQRRGLRSVLVLGDDTTDVDAFVAMSNLSGVEGLTAAVLAPDTPAELLAATDYALAGTDAAQALLTWLAGEVGASS